MNQATHRLAAAILAGTALGAATALSAQTASVPTTDGISAADGDIIVTATKRAERIQDVPLAITAVTAEAIERSGSRSLKDIATSVPSLYFSESQGPVQSNVAIRGVGSTGGVAGLEPSVGIYVDGVYLDRTSLGILDFNDLERIEVLRGPQGTLFGKNTPAGLINYITKRPSFTLGADASATYGNYDNYGGTVGITGPIVADKLAIRVSGYYNQHSGYLHNIFNNRDVNGHESYGVRGRLLWKPSDRLELLATYEHSRTFEDCCAAEFGPLGGTNRAVAAAIGKPFPAVIDPNDRQIDIDGSNHYQDNINAYTLEGNYDLGDYRLTSISSLRDYNQEAFIDADFSQLDFLRKIAGNRQHRQFSQEVRIASPEQHTLSFVAGLYYFYKRQNQQGPTTYGTDTASIFALLGPPLSRLARFYASPMTSFSGSDIVNRSYAAFGQAMLKLSPTVDVSAGIRYTYDNKSIHAFQTTTEVVPILATPYNESDSKGDGQFSGVVNIRWRPDVRTLLYASATRGYKAFGFNDSNVNVAIGQNRFFKAELSTGGEVGLKKTFTGLQLNLTGFYTVFTDYQASSFAPGNTFLLQNAGKLTTKGVEAEATVRPAEGVAFNLNYTYLEAFYDRFLNGPGLEGGPVTQDLSGKPLQDAPRHSINASGQYDFAISPQVSSFVRGEVTLRSKIYTAQNLDPLLIQPASVLVNARAGLGYHGVALEVWGRNLTNQTILYRGGTPPAIITTGSRIRFISDPRTYGVTGRVSF